MSKESRLSEAKQRLLELQRQRGRPLAASAINKRLGPENPVSLSFSQEQLWRLDQTASILAPLLSDFITIHGHGSCDMQGAR
jgi:hypothetical protein